MAQATKKVWVWFPDNWFVNIRMHILICGYPRPCKFMTHTPHPSLLNFQYDIQKGYVTDQRMNRRIADYCTTELYRSSSCSDVVYSV